MVVAAPGTGTGTGTGIGIGIGIGCGNGAPSARARARSCEGTDGLSEHADDPEAQVGSASSYQAQKHIEDGGRLRRRPAGDPVEAGLVTRSELACALGDAGRDRRGGPAQLVGEVRAADSGGSRASGGYSVLRDAPKPPKSRLERGARRRPHSR
jgi:hypothetical protein